MSGQDSPCTLCKGQGSKRISSELAEKYKVLVLSQDKRREITSLLNNYPVCAVARMAVVYQDQSLADALVRRYGQSSSPLSLCEYQAGSQRKGLVSQPLLHEFVHAVQSYVSRSISTAHSHRVSRVDPNSDESVFGVPSPEYGNDTKQSIILGQLSQPEQLDLRIISAESAWGIELSRRAEKREKRASR